MTETSANTPPARVFSWGWREQPDMTAIAAAVTEMSGGGQVFMREIETGSDQYAWVVFCGDELTAEQAYRLYEPTADTDSGAPAKTVHAQAREAVGQMWNDAFGHAPF